ncbi:hypothetical protein F6P96_22835 (plasmid) [Escherichia coli]|nr:hypothetical protein F6P96_22835 [Escherichia coli]
MIIGYARKPEYLSRQRTKPMKPTKRLSKSISEQISTGVPKRQNKARTWRTGSDSIGASW